MSRAVAPSALAGAYSITSFSSTIYAISFTPTRCSNPSLKRTASQPLSSNVSQLIGESVFRILLVALLAFGAWKGYEKYQSQRAAQQFQGIPQEIDISNNSSRRNRSIDIAPKFQCDGRTHCSQMTSCEEATFFLKNCPGTKMDGNNDGVPCEQQWCK